MFADLAFNYYFFKKKRLDSKRIKKRQSVIIDKLNKNIVLEEEVIKNTIEINKLYEYDSSNKREKDITFLISDNNSKALRSARRAFYLCKGIVKPVSIMKRYDHCYNKEDCYEGKRHIIT